MLRTFGNALSRFQPGPRELSALAEWEDGRHAETRITVQWDPGKLPPPDSRGMPAAGLAAIMLHGADDGPSWKLAEDGKRGDLQIVLDADPVLKPGDAIELNAPATERCGRLTPRRPIPCSTARGPEIPRLGMPPVLENKHVAIGAAGAFAQGQLAAVANRIGTRYDWTFGLGRAGSAHGLVWRFRGRAHRAMCLCRMLRVIDYLRHRGPNERGGSCVPGTQEQGLHCLSLPVGNCPMGRIRDKQSMALAWMGSAGVNQMIGYIVSTWYGKGGWGILARSRRSSRA